VKPIQKRLFKALPFTQRAVRWAVYLARELMVLAFVKYPKLMKAGERQARRHLETQVADPGLRAKLTPHYDMGCKRVLPSNDFYPAVAKPNVNLITDAITSISRDAVVTADGTQYPVDAIIFGTGFHVTDNPMTRLVHGRDGHSLSEIFDGDLPAYLGTTIPHFPNLIMMTGPNTGLGHTSMVFMIESQLNYVCDALRRLDASGMDILEVRPEVATAYNAELQNRLPNTVWGSGCASWYLDKRGRNITLWPGFTFAYHRRTRRMDPSAHVLVRRRVTAASTRSAGPARSASRA
jgi:cation diffusion facilitator CzcD-associated flavoprotein CzcO